MQTCLDVSVRQACSLSIELFDTYIKKELYEIEDGSNCENKEIMKEDIHRVMES